MKLPALACLFAAALCLGGCDRLLEKATKDDLAAGDKKVSAGDFHGAIGDYEAALDGTEKSANAHWKLAVLYDDKLKDQRNAVHHFARYLDVAPAGPHAKDARAMLGQAETRLAMAQAKGGLMTQEDAVRLKNANLKLQKDLDLLRAQKAATPPPHVAGGPKPGELEQKPVPPGARTYVVQAHDTFATIAQKFYKSKARYQQIIDANYYNATGTPKIKVGQTLIIP